MDTLRLLARCFALAGCVGLAATGGCNGTIAAPDGQSPTDARADTAASPDTGARPDAPSSPDAGASDGATDGAPGMDVTASPDATADSGPVDPCVGRLVCDDFERYAAGMPLGAPWQRHENNGTVVVDDARAYSGTHAIHVHTNAGTGRTALFGRSGMPVFPVPGNLVYGRMMFYATSAANNGVHWTMIHSDGPLRAGVNATYQYGGQWMGRLMANYYANTSPPFDCWDHSMTAMPTNRWTCYQWRFDGAHNDMRLWVDGTEITDVHVAGYGEGCVSMTGSMIPWPAPTFQNMTVGWESYQMDDARDAWVDDVIFDDAPIDCPPAH